MDYQSIPEKPVVMNVGQVEPARKTYFYERHDGSIVSCNDEGSAATMHRKFKQLGVSDGTKFRQAVIESHQLFRAGDKDGARARLLKGEQEELEAARGHFETPTIRKVFEPNGPTGFRPI